MAAASGPVETSSGKPEEMDEFIAPEPPRPRQANNDNQENNGNEFKRPEPNVSGSERKKPPSNDSEAETSESGNDDTTSITSNDTKTVSSEHKKRTPVLSPAEQLKLTQVSIPYKEPVWGGLPPESEKFSFDVLKNGTVIDNVELGKKSWIVFGRLPSNDVSMEHPSLSRHHAVVQYREAEEEGHDRGWYLYDLDSTHGTWVNKRKVLPKVYCRLRVGHVVKFGGSTRLFILQGPEQDQEPESELSVTELKQQTARLKRETEVLKQAELEEEEERERQRQKILDLRGCSWGMGEDAAEEDEDAPSSIVGLTPQHEHLYRDDPKKALKGFYEREGCDLPDYQFAEAGFGKHKCIVELPVDGPNGEVLVAEATVSGKKKDAVVACALEACRLLDMHDMLHASKHESRKRKGKNWADDDFYDSDEDTFLDRTGTIEKKRIFRMKKCGKEDQAETYESLVPKHKEVQERITEIEEKLQQAKAESEAKVAGDDEDALEAYMRGIKAGGMDTSTRLSLKRELLELRTQEQKLRRLVNLARPTHLPPLMPQVKREKKTGGVGGQQEGGGKVGLGSATRKMAIVVRGPSRPCPAPQEGPVQSVEEGFEEEEEEEEEEKEDNTNNSKTTTSSVNNSSSSSSARTATETPTSVKPRSHTEQKPVPVTVQKSKSEKGGDGASTEKTVSVLSSIQALASAKTASSLKSASPTKTSSAKTAGSDSKDRQRGDAEPSSAAQSEVATAKTSPVKPAPAQQAFAEPPKKKKKQAADGPKMKGDYDDSDPNYAMWMPPKDQSGDGRTSLNDKLGY